MVVVLLDEGMMDWVTCQLRFEETNEAFEVMLLVLRMMVRTGMRHVCFGFFYELVCARSFFTLFGVCIFFVELCYNSRVISVS